MVVTHLFQILGFMAMEPPTSLEPIPISEEKNKVFRSMKPIDPREVVRGQYSGYREEEGVDPESDTETLIALRCEIDNWRWAGVPFFLRTGKKMAEGQRIISIAFQEPPKSMFPANSGVGAQGPDHLTFDLADASKVSLSFYGKRPGPGMRLDKQSLQFSMSETGLAGEVLEAYERLILDAMRGDRTLFTTADGIERLWEVSKPLLEAPPPVRLYGPGSWGPKSIHQLIAPNAWRLPFERAWRDPNTTGPRDGCPLAGAHASLTLTPQRNQDCARRFGGSDPALWERGLTHEIYRFRHAERAGRARARWRLRLPSQRTSPANGSV